MIINVDVGLNLTYEGFFLDPERKKEILKKLKDKKYIDHAIDSIAEKWAGVVAKEKIRNDDTDSDVSEQDNVRQGNNDVGGVSGSGCRDGERRGLLLLARRHGDGADQ